MKRDEEPYLSVLDPLPNTVPRALLDASHQRRVVDYAIEDFARGVCDHARVWLSAVLGSRTLACAHFAGGAWVLRCTCETAVDALPRGQAEVNVVMMSSREQEEGE